MFRWVIVGKAQDFNPVVSPGQRAGRVKVYGREVFERSESLEHAFDSKLKLEDGAFGQLEGTVFGDFVWFYLFYSQDDCLAYRNVLRHKIAEGPACYLILVLFG